MKKIDPRNLMKEYRPVFDWLQSLDIPFRLYEDDQGTVRFHHNFTIHKYVETALNEIAVWSPIKERAELYALIGYSLDEFWDVFSAQIAEYQIKMEQLEYQNNKKG